jgi:hypothetical protein|tara:strand:+ start:3719 stop:4300 length:582 start_codon:yes stop_codon:yes gene_type:complete
MAQEMETYISIKNGNVDISKKLDELFTPVKGEYNTRTIELINRLYGTNFTWDVDLSRDENEANGNTWPEYKWLGDNVGSKWIYSEYDSDEDCAFIHLNLKSAWSVPQGFIKKLTEELRKIHDECYIVGTYEDESYNPMGAFVYGNNFDGIEDLDVEIDEDRVWEDDYYIGELRNKTEQLKEDIHNVYLEHLQP